MSIYKKATGNATVVPAFPPTYFVAYDTSGNIFSEGFMQSSNAFLLGEIAKGTRSVQQLTISGANPNFPGGLQYAEGKLEVGDTSSPRAQIFTR